MEPMNRRSFIKGTLAAGLGAGLGAAPRPAEAIAPVATGEFGPTVQPGRMPTGRIGKLELSRLISGGNLMGGWAHGRDLIYLNQLMVRYNTEKKIFETLQVLEEKGVNAIISHPKFCELFQRYWKETGGKMQMIADGHPTPEDLFGNMERSVDMGACAVYVQGGVADKFKKQGDFERLGELIARIKAKGVPAGLGAHCIKTIQESERLGFDPDFYVKTLHTKNYWSAQRPEQEGVPVIDNKHDNYWCTDLDETVESMGRIEKPWIAFKVLAAGAFHPSDPENGFQFAFDQGADFICVGMFDWQVEEDVRIATEAVERTREKRTRPWYA